MGLCLFPIYFIGEPRDRCSVKRDSRTFLDARTAEQSNYLHVFYKNSGNVPIEVSIDLQVPAVSLVISQRRIRYLFDNCGKEKSAGSGVHSSRIRDSFLYSSVTEEQAIS